MPKQRLAQPLRLIQDESITTDWHFLTFVYFSNTAKRCWPVNPPANPAELSKSGLCVMKNIENPLRVSSGGGGV